MVAHEKPPQRDRHPELRGRRSNHPLAAGAACQASHRAFFICLQAIGGCSDPCSPVLLNQQLSLDTELFSGSLLVNIKGFPGTPSEVFRNNRWLGQTVIQVGLQRPPARLADRHCNHSSCTPTSSPCHKHGQACTDVQLTSRICMRPGHPTGWGTVNLQRMSVRIGELWQVTCRVAC
jgi:hypothetical protein